jgi:hypothetical protein
MSQLIGFIVIMIPVLAGCYWAGRIPDALQRAASDRAARRRKSSDV